jgi:hypothetical protein
MGIRCLLYNWLRSLCPCLFLFVFSVIILAFLFFLDRHFESDSKVYTIYIYIHDIICLVVVFAVLLRFVTSWWIFCYFHSKIVQKVFVFTFGVTNKYVNLM